MESLIVCGSVKLTRSSKVGPISIDGCEFGTAACFELRPVDCARSKFFRLEAVQRPALCPSPIQMPRVLMWGLSLYCCVSHRCCTAEQRLRTLGNESCSLLQMGHTAKRGCSLAREG